MRAAYTSRATTNAFRAKNVRMSQLLDFMPFEDKEKPKSADVEARLLAWGKSMQTAQRKRKERVSGTM